MLTLTNSKGENSRSIAIRLTLCKIVQDHWSKHLISTAVPSYNRTYKLDCVSEQEVCPLCYLLNLMVIFQGQRLRHPIPIAVNGITGQTKCLLWQCDSSKVLRQGVTHDIFFQHFMLFKVFYRLLKIYIYIYIYIYPKDCPEPGGVTSRDQRPAVAGL